MRLPSRFELDTPARLSIWGDLSLNRKVDGVAVLTNVPAPYRIPVWNHLNDLLGGRITVLFTMTSWPQRSWTVPVDEMNFDWEFLVNDGGSQSILREIKVAVAMLLFLLHSRPAVVICGGYDSLAAWMSFAWCKLFASRFILWMESNARDHRRSGRLKTWLKSLIVSQANAIATPGKASVEYAQVLGADERKICVVGNNFDIEFFVREAEKVDATREKKRRGYPSKIILYCGRLVPHKGISTLMEAFRAVSPELPDVGLVIVGQGPEEGAIRDFCRNAGLKQVYLEGPQPYKRMPYYYSLADMLVLPTLSDPYGFVVMEAFACGVPAIVSRVAGVCEDLIVEGETGFTVEPGDALGLGIKIIQLLRDEDLRIRMGNACRARIQGRTADCTARKFLDVAMGASNGVPVKT